MAAYRYVVLNTILVSNTSEIMEYCINIVEFFI